MAGVGGTESRHVLGSDCPTEVGTPASPSVAGSFLVPSLEGIYKTTLL